VDTAFGNAGVVSGKGLSTTRDLVIDREAGRVITARSGSAEAPEVVVQRYWL
jgi:hypothetical protein